MNATKSLGLLYSTTKQSVIKNESPEDFPATVRNGTLSQWSGDNVDHSGWKRNSWCHRNDSINNRRECETRQE